jgi:hypothetical protein
MERPVTPKLLATFIEYAATGKVTTLEWHRFIVAHYLDPRMEEARRKCARIIIESGHPVEGERLVALRALADSLRSGN